MAGAFTVRLLLSRLTEFPETVENRIELANSQVGIKAVREAAYLLKHAVPIYENGCSCQPSPFIVGVFGWFDRWGLDDILFIALDLAAGYLVHRITAALRWEQRAEKKKRGSGHQEDPEPAGCMEDFKPDWALAIYLFNPYSLLVCLAKSSALFTTVATLGAFHCALKGCRAKAPLLLSLAAYLTVYSLPLVIPLGLLLAKRSAGSTPASIALPTLLFAGFLAAWHALSYALLGFSWSFLWTTIGCSATVSDLRPNIGLAWYLFVEMFDHFRSFFLAVFQLNQLIYVMPATIRFHGDPMMLAFVLVTVAALFKPYPTIADTLLLLVFASFLGASLVQRSRLLPLYLFTMIFVSILGPINHHYWVHQGIGNANFLYAVVLFYNAANILLTTDLVRQWLLRDLERLNPGLDLSRVYQR